MCLLLFGVCGLAHHGFVSVPREIRNTTETPTAVTTLTWWTEDASKESRPFMMWWTKDASQQSTMFISMKSKEPSEEAVLSISHTILDAMISLSPNPDIEIHFSSTTEGRYNKEDYDGIIIANNVANFPSERSKSLTFGSNWNSGHHSGRMKKSSGDTTVTEDFGSIFIAPYSLHSRPSLMQQDMTTRGVASTLRIMSWNPKGYRSNIIADYHVANPFYDLRCFSAKSLWMIDQGVLAYMTLQSLGIPLHDINIKQRYDPRTREDYLEATITPNYFKYRCVMTGQAKQLSNEDSIIQTPQMQQVHQLKELKRGARKRAHFSWKPAF
jgi:hypothetical protein